MIWIQTPVGQDEAASAFDDIALSQSSKSRDTEREPLKPLVIPTDQGNLFTAELLLPIMGIYAVNLKLAIIKVCQLLRKGQL